MSDPAAEVPNLPSVYRLVTFDEIDSTNAEATRRAIQGAEDGTLVWARSQTSGRGRRGRQWASPRGNLYLSVVLRPDCPLAQAAQLGFVAALAAGDAVGSVAPPLIDVTYKWPNDVLFNGRKGAGILLESSLTAEGALDWLVVGVGVNIASFPEEVSRPATSLRFEGCPASLTDKVLLEAFSRHFLTWVNRWLDDGFTPVRNTWLRHAVKLGERIEVRLANETFEGTFADLDEMGCLLLDQGAGAPRRISAGDVYFKE